MSTLGIGIVGAGRMGRIRALSARAHPLCRVSWVVDSADERARALGDELGVESSTDWQSALMKEDTDAVVVATTHRHLPDITDDELAAMKNMNPKGPMELAQEERMRKFLQGDDSAPSPDSPEHHH